MSPTVIVLLPIPLFTFVNIYIFSAHVLGANLFANVVSYYWIDPFIIV